MHLTYEGRLNQMVNQVDEMFENSENVKIDWHQFKYYKEKEYRSLEN